MNADTRRFITALQLARARYLVRAGWSLEAAAMDAAKLGATFPGGAG